MSNAWDEDLWNKRREKLDEIADFYAEQQRLIAMAQQAAFDEDEEELALYLTELADLERPADFDFKVDRKERVWN